MAQLNFDPRRVEPNAVFEPVPTSWYTGQITESEMKATSSKNGHYLELKVQIMGGDYNNRTVYDRLNIDNPNAQAVDIAYRQLSAICHAVGLGQQEIQDTQVLHGRPFLVKINERSARTDQTTGTRYEASNEIKGYKAIDPTAPPVLGPSKAQQRPFAGGSMGGVGQGMPQGFAPQGAPQSPAGWGAPQAPQAPAQAPTGWGQAPAANGWQQPQAPVAQQQPQYQQPPVQPQVPQPAPIQYVQPPAPVQQPPQQPPQQFTPPQYAQQQTPPAAAQQPPVSNVGNPALAQGSPPPWAQQQPAPVANGAGATPPWQK